MRRRQYAIIDFAIGVFESVKFGALQTRQVDSPSLRSGARARRATFLPIQFDSTCSKSKELLATLLILLALCSPYLNTLPWFPESFGKLQDHSSFPEAKVAQQDALVLDSFVNDLSQYLLRKTLVKFIYNLAKLPWRDGDDLLRGLGLP